MMMEINETFETENLFDECEKKGEASRGHPTCCNKETVQSHFYVTNPTERFITLIKFKLLRNASSKNV